ncbi:hypothetical protein CICLE_v10010219mg, partial [Citrus x clementina]
ILAESEFAAPTITKLIPIPFSTSGAFVAYNCVMTRGRLPGGGGSSVVGKREPRRD